MSDETTDIIETGIIGIQRVYQRPLGNATVMDMMVILECGGSTLVSGLTHYEHGMRIRVSKSNIMGYVEPKKVERIKAEPKKVKKSTKVSKIKKDKEI
jgi:hypothetical protein